MNLRLKRLHLLPVRRSGGRVGAVAVCALLASSVAVGMASAAIPNSANGVISACYRANGAVRVIDRQARRSCGAGERLLEWSAWGLRFRGVWSPAVRYRVNDIVTSDGSAFVAKRNSYRIAPTNTVNWGVLAARGASGPAGPAGTTGTTGATGATGGVGPIGATGATGPAGPIGATGAAGPAGPIGATGAAGPQGVPGPIGPAFGLKGAGSMTGQMPRSTPPEGYRLTTTAFVAPANATCLVTSSVQAYALAGAVDATVQVLNAVSRNGILADDAMTADLLTTDGSAGFQAPVTRSAVFSVSAGESIRFGVFIRSSTTGWFNQYVVVASSYDCS